MVRYLGLHGRLSLVDPNVKPNTASFYRLASPLSPATALPKPKRLMLRSAESATTTSRTSPFQQRKRPQSYSPAAATAPASIPPASSAGWSATQTVLCVS